MSYTIKKQKKEEETTVKTYDGGKAKIEDCVYVIGAYFIKGDTRITTDFFEDEGGNTDILIIKNKSIRFFTALNDKEDVDLTSEKYTYYRENERKLIPVYSLSHIGIVLFFGHNILLSAGFVECLKTGTFYPQELKGHADLNKTGRYRQVNALKGLREDPIYNQKYGLSSSTFSISEGIRYTMGLEIETIIGYLPQYLDESLNYEAVHDGSLKDANGESWGAEYVTGVLVGDMGFRQLKLLCSQLSKRCQIDKRAGVHCHLGGMKFSKEFIVYMYYLACKIEKELFSTLPHSRRNNEYCRPLKKLNIYLNNKFDSSQEYHDYIEDMYNSILQYVSHQDRLDPTVVNKRNDHPLGAKCGYNHSTARYSWLNFVPAMFNTRGNGIFTLEIRNHQGSLNYTKIRNWILLFMGMCNVVENHKSFITSTNSITLKDIIDLSFPKKAKELNEYFDSRKATFLTNVESITSEEKEYREEMEDNNTNLKSL